MGEVQNHAHSMDMKNMSIIEELRNETQHSLTSIRSEEMKESMRDGFENGSYVFDEDEEFNPTGASR